ncbi:hypothetical protein RDI58_014830 [Solanum bulbocastanum]|uniref:DUF4218 domain-containing protein n=1 Tax=Solanum bulbocastanum TaxID=147425 RepID=A0AAN8TED2_SOLBU
MVHLPIHLAGEAEIDGPIHYRWMYPIEQWLYFLKCLIGNRACPEGSIAEGYVANECMTLFSSAIEKGRQQQLTNVPMSSSHEKRAINEKSNISLEKEYMQVNTSFHPSTKQAKQYIHDVERSIFFHDFDLFSGSAIVRDEELDIKTPPCLLVKFLLPFIHLLIK